MISEAFPACRVADFVAAEDALSHCTHDTPGLAIIEITLPGIDGLEATRRMKVLFPQTVVVIHTSSDLPVYREAAQAAGVSAFIGKGSSPS